MVKKLMELCLDLISKPCNTEINLSKYWLNCGIQ